MNIFYCCGVLQEQKKIWWRNFLRAQPAVTVSPRFSSAVTHIVYSRESTSLQDVLKATRATSLSDVKIVKSSWLMACVKARKRVSEDGHLLASELGSHADSQTLPSSKRSRAALSEDGSDTDRHIEKQQKHNSVVPLSSVHLEPALPPPPPCVHLGSLTVAACGVGSLAWGVTYPDSSARPSADDITALVKAAVTASTPYRVLIDTADSYCTDSHDFGYMESILGDVCSSIQLTERPVIATKGGMKRIGCQSTSWREAGHQTPEAWEACIRASLSRLQCSAAHPLPLWQVHHSSPAGLAAAMTACQKLVAENLILHVGLCNVSVADVELCQQYLPIACVQNAYSLWDRTAEKELPASCGGRATKRGMLRFCAENSIPFVAYGVLGGLAARRGEDKWSQFPELLALAEHKGINVTTLMLAMMRHRFPCVLPLVGSRRLQHVEMMRELVGVRLTAREMSVFPS